eukprot:TCONS_00057582-protein
MMEEIKPPKRMLFSANKPHAKRLKHVNTTSENEQKKRQIERRQSFDPAPNIFTRLGSLRSSRRPVVVASAFPRMNMTRLPWKTRIIRTIYPVFFHFKMKFLKTFRLRSVRTNVFVPYQPP